MSLAPSSSSYDEGVIKYVCDHQSGRLPEVAGEPCATLGGWRHVLYRLGIVGCDAGRYGGAGFGNMSARLPPYPGERGARRFVITGTQTGHVASLDLGGYAVVDSYAPRENKVRSRGPSQPSSEAMTHGAIYDLSPRIRFVFHAHAPVLWARREDLRLPTTAPDVPYGTPAMASEVARLYRETRLSEQAVLVMAGHEDGVISFGTSAESAGLALIRELARAHALG